MPGEPILIVDDTPVNLRLTRIILINEGYKVITASSAEEALELMRSFRPRMVLTGIQLPGMDGLELAQRLKSDENNRGIVVIAMTAHATPGDEQRAVDAGCDGCFTRPIDTRTLGARIREHLERTAPPPETQAGEAQPVTMPPAELLALRRRFLSEGQELVRGWLLDLEGQFDPDEAARATHQWVGTGGLLGYTAISRLSREAEQALLERPLETSSVRDAFTELALSFNSPREAREAPVSSAILSALSGKRIAVVGFPPKDAQRLCMALERASAAPAFFTHSERPDSRATLECHLAVVYMGQGIENSAWLDPERAHAANRPMVFAGSRDDLLALSKDAQSLAREFLMDFWQPEEALVRLSLALSQPPPGPSRAASPAERPGPGGRVPVLVADDDPTVMDLVRTALRNFGMEVHEAADGPAALDALRRIRPRAAVLDVNMPGMDGYEVLAAVRGEQLPVRVLLLTARQQESDVMRGFALGADDYMVKPFSPMELVARLKRLLGR
jgi:DNA-binding response OmpR family regulator